MQVPERDTPKIVRQEGCFSPPYCWLLLDDQTRSRISHIECHRNMTKAEAIVYFTNRGFTNVRAD